MIFYDDFRFVISIFVIEVDISSSESSMSSSPNSGEVLAAGHGATASHLYSGDRNPPHTPSVYGRPMDSVHSATAAGPP